MENLREKIKDDGYRYKVKCTLGLEQTGRGLQQFVEEKFTLFVNGKVILNGQKPEQKYFTVKEHAHITNGGHFRSGLSTRVRRRKDQVWEWNSKINCGGSSLCETSFQKILALHKDYKTQKGLTAEMFRENSDTSDKLSLEWAIAKMFMPRGNQNNKGPQDSDPAALLHIIENCDFFRHIRVNNVVQLRQFRNKLFHSSEHSVTKNEADDLFGAMKILLDDAKRDPEIGQNTLDMINAHIERLEKLKTSEMTVSMFNEAHFLKKRAIYYQFQQILDEKDGNNLDQLKLLLEMAEKNEVELREINALIRDNDRKGSYEAEEKRIKDQLDETRREIEIYRQQATVDKVKLEQLEKQEKFYQKQIDNLWGLVRRQTEHDNSKLENKEDTRRKSQ